MSRWGSQKHWTHAGVVCAIRDFYAKAGWYPETLDFAMSQGQLPSRTTVFRLFGSLAEARRQAGMAKGGFEGHGGSGRGGGWTKGRPRRHGHQGRRIAEKMGTEHGTDRPGRQ